MSRINYEDYVVIGELTWEVVLYGEQKSNN